jgi:outer membrane protein assembly factor BamE (lipoprotein component of BamABCDE complex)
MTSHLVSRLPRALLAAGLLAGVAAAQAASGYTVSHDQEMQIAQGMSRAEVRSTLGRPAQHIHYGNEPGPTFTYRVAGSDETLFDVDFDAGGKVASAGERVVEPD